MRTRPIPSSPPRREADAPLEPPTLDAAVLKAPEFPVESAPVVLDPPVAVGLSKASRSSYQGFFGRLGARLGSWFGTHEARNLACGAVLLGAARVFEPAAGAPLSKPVGVVDPPRHVLDLVDRLYRAEGHQVAYILAELRPAQIAEVDAALGDGWGTSSFSVREFIHNRTEGADTKEALRVLDEKLVQLFRGNERPVHDLARDPSGIFAPASDGRLPQTIHKILELRRLKRLDLEDLATRHEITANNALQLHSSPPRAFARMLEAIEHAEDFVHVAFFIWKGRRGEQLADALIKKAQEGKTVRVIVDEAGAWLGGRPGQLEALIERMRAGGVHVECNRVIDASRPTGLIGAPDHRKTVVVDGKFAFIGGVNVGDEYVDAWHDLVLECQGDLVHQIHAEWFLSWMALGGYVDPWLSDQGLRSRYFPRSEVVGDTRAKVTQTIPGINPEIVASVVQLLDQAHTSIDLANPYITEDEIHQALERALARQVKVRIIIPAENNHYFCDLIARPAFRRMLEAGAEIWAYPGMAHGKILIVDRRHVSVGTANLDRLSLHKIAELNVVVDDPEFADQTVTEVFERDLAKSDRLEPEDITLLQRLLGTAGRPLAPML